MICIQASFCKLLPEETAYSRYWFIAMSKLSAFWKEELQGVRF